MKTLRPIPPLAACLLLVVGTLGVYWRVTSHGFVDYDDGDYVMANSHVQAGLGWAGAKWAFTTGHASNWHPLTWLSHMLDVSLFGQNAGGHHVTSLLLHCVNSALVFLGLRALTAASWRSFMVAALFAWHPLHVESVAWISERKDVLSAGWALLCLLFYASFVAESKVRSPKPKIRYGLALTCFALGLLSKPMLVTWPFVLLLLDVWPLGRAISIRLLVEKIPFFLLSAASSVVTFLVQRKGGAVSPLETLPIAARLGNAVVSYARYLRKTFWPDDLSVLYPHPGHWPTLQVLAAVVLLVGVTAIAIGWRKRAPFLFVGWLWFIGMLVPVIGLVQVGIQSMADRYTYLAHVGLFTALIWGAGECLARWPRMQPAGLGFGGLILSVCAVLTFRQTGIWADSETLFTNAVRVTENNYLAYNNLGFYLANHGRADEALTNYEASLRINPRYAEARNNLGHVLAGRKRLAEAIAHYRAGLAAAPDNLEIHNNLGNALAEIGDPEGAMAEYRFVLQRNPEHADAHNNLGIALAMRGQLAEAMEHFQLALRSKPTDAGAHGNLGNAFAAQRNWTDAIRHYRETLRLSPKDAQTWNNLGNVLAEQGRLEEAVTNYAEALRLNANNPEAEYNLGCALLRLGRREEAVRHLSEALRLSPDYTAAREQLRAMGSTAPPR